MGCIGLREDIEGVFYSTGVRKVQLQTTAQLQGL